MKSNRIVNDYVLIYLPDHPKAMVGNNWDGYIYEHIVVAESILGRRLLEGEVVHHLDCNRSNNSPDNLLVISNPMHAKLHTWLDKNIIIPKPDYAARKALGCVRCSVCNTPIHPDNKYCSIECNAQDSRKVDRPTKEELNDLIWSKPTSQLALDYNVSDTAIAKWCKSMGIEKPPRGYWMKKAFNKI